MTSKCRLTFAGTNFEIVSLSGTCSDRGHSQAGTLKLELLIRLYDPLYAQLWTALTSIQQSTPLAVVQHRGVKR
jgi:hypothetical protein